MSIVNSRLCKLVGLKYPIIQAGMGPFPTTDLAIASANAGALGVMCTAAIGANMREEMPAISKHFCKAAGANLDDTPEVIARKMYRKAFEKTRGCPGALAPNVMVAVESKATAEIAIGTLIKMREEDPEFKASFRVLITSAGDPMPWAEMIKKAGLIWMHVMPSVKAAQRCKKAGVDVIIASGHEGGFHISWEPVHSMILLPNVVEAVSDEKTLVVGAGGFADGRTLAAALTMGADGVQMGTRFLATEESDFPSMWKQAIVDAGDRGTLVARGVVGPARWIKSPRSIVHASNTLQRAPGVFLGVPDDDSTDTTLLNYEFESLEANYSGEKDKAMWAGGEVAQRINGTPKVKDLIESIMADCELRLRDANKYLD